MRNEVFSRASGDSGQSARAGGSAGGKRRFHPRAGRHGHLRHRGPGARPVLNAFVEEVAKRGLKDVMVTQTGCIGICQYEPVVEIVEDGRKTTYVKMTPEKAVRVVNDHLVNGNVVTEYTIGANTQ